MQNCDIPENLQNFYNKDTFWTKKVLQKLTTLSQKFNFNYIWPESLNCDNHEEIKLQFELLHTEIHKAYEKHLNKHRLHNINKYIDRRQQDFSDNQTRILNSILERKPQKITINRLLITPDEENPQLITDQEDIERITINHYQNVASSNNPALFTSYENLTPFWQHIYKEKHKSPEHQSILTTIITLEELTTTIQSLPNNKAPGPTGITYEFWKHFPKTHYKLLLIFFNNILNTGFIPSAWKEALLYPIPKPEFWNYQLDKTRPIILLETLRKIFVKIITDRLNKFLSSTNALQPNNQAGIAGSSTAEIILTIQTCIDIQITQNQKFYIMVQDLSHKNSVIIGNHLTNSFDLRNGVIQGEVISPILWVLYYDPLFEAINQTTYGGINLQANHPMNIYDHLNDPSIHSLQKNCKLLGYLDDTTWLNSSISHLEEHLNIADEFYNFSNIKINKTKCHLLTNDQDCINKGSVEINFGPTRINVDIIGKTDNLRILGAYFNAFNNHNKLYKKLLTTTNHLIHMIKKKKITEDMIIYVINKVILPRLEYMTQHIVVPNHINNRINIILRSAFKTISGLPKNFYTAAIHTSIIPNIIDFHDLQIRAKMANFYTASFNPITSDCIKILLLLSQNNFWYPRSPINIIQTFSKPLAKFNNIELLIHLLRNYNLTFTTNFNFSTKGGYFPIVDYLINPNYFFRYIRSLKTKRIMFLDQIIQPDSAFFKSWNEIKNSLHNKKGPIPLWYKHMINQYTLNPNNLRLNFDLPHLLQQILHVKRPKKGFNSPNQMIRLRNFWAHFWSPSVKDTTYGKILSKDNHNPNSPMMIMEHWVPCPIIDNFNNARDHTPNSRPNFLQPCEGCSLHYPYYIADLRPKYTTIEIYTDGACNVEQRQDITMGIGWLVTQPSTPSPITFSGSCKHFPSSTKAEAYAICTALLICPPRSTVNIYTDSLCCINTFHTITKRLTTPRRQLKIPNHNIWFIIAKIIAVNSLIVHLHKVKAHSGNRYNDKADILAKAGFTSTHLIEINQKHLPNNIQFIWDQHQDNIVVDQNVRHITRDIGNRQKFNAWLNYTTNTVLKQASFNQQIDWSMTEEFFKYNPHDRPTSHKLTKFRAWQYKMVNNLLPTMDVLY
ncbi:hypothetical protein RclHR1_02310014 [Rhizophagus clarus]|uniref:RNase H type-1 domain-containing protein n=1 Tax=Rhizophagus clarus TaxID=94130 RepID=A0A2Z6RQ56_9GLOM|nr:hypothetical protein RclHR1_02310014 [Rhizophagus clarus]